MLPCLPVITYSGRREGNGAEGWSQGGWGRIFSTALVEAREDMYFIAKVCSLSSLGISIYWTSTEYSRLEEKIRISLFSPDIEKYFIPAQ